MTVIFDTIVPKPLITMINTMMFLTVQVSAEERERGREGEGGEEGGEEGRRI